jgi:glycosyltransferase involved in cell wall biosynthesis
MNKENLKIAQVVCVLPPQAGGIGMVSHSYSDQLSKRGYSVTAFIPKIAGQDDSNKRYKVKHLTPLLRSGFGAVMPQLLWRLWNYDIINLHYPLFGSAFFVALLKKIRGTKVKLIINYHMDVNLSGWKRYYEKIARSIFIKFILDSADKIIISSEDYVENCQIQNYYFQNIEKFSEIPFGVSKKFKPLEKTENLLQKHGLSSSDKVVLFVGGLGTAHYFKGVNHLIKAFKLIDDENIKALIVGGGNLLENYKSLVNKLNLEKRIKFSGFVEKELIKEYFNLGDVLVLPSINSSEAFGIVLIEAMACGVPVLASNLKGVRSVVNPGINGLLIEPKNTRDIAEKIKYIMNDDATRKKFGKASIESVEKHYRWSIIIDKLEKLFSDIDSN